MSVGRRSFSAPRFISFCWSLDRTRPSHPVESPGMPFPCARKSPPISGICGRCQIYRNVFVVFSRVSPPCLSCRRVSRFCWKSTAVMGGAEGSALACCFFLRFANQLSDDHGSQLEKKCRGLLVFCSFPGGGVGVPAMARLALRARSVTNTKLFQRRLLVHHLSMAQAASQKFPFIP